MCGANIPLSLVLNRIRYPPPDFPDPKGSSPKAEMKVQCIALLLGCAQVSADLLPQPRGDDLPIDASGLLVLVTVWMGARVLISLSRSSTLDDVQEALAKRVSVPADSIRLHGAELPRMPTFVMIDPKKKQEWLKENARKVLVSGLGASKGQVLKALGNRQCRAIVATPMDQGIRRDFIFLEDDAGPVCADPSAAEIAEMQNKNQ